MTKRRETIQKHEILNILNKKEHPCIDEIYKQVKQTIPNISLATIYRNLKVMEDEGKILKIDKKNKICYDSVWGNHNHFICQSCGSIFDIENIDNNEILSKFEHENLKPNSVNITFRGTCQTCKSNTDKILI